MQSIASAAYLHRVCAVFVLFVCILCELRIRTIFEPNTAIYAANERNALPIVIRLEMMSSSRRTIYIEKNEYNCRITARLMLLLFFSFKNSKSEYMSAARVDAFTWVG